MSTCWDFLHQWQKESVIAKYALTARGSIQSIFPGNAYSRINRFPPLRTGKRHSYNSVFFFHRHRIAGSLNTTFFYSGRWGYLKNSVQQPKGIGLFLKLHSLRQYLLPKNLPLVRTSSTTRQVVVIIIIVVEVRIDSRGLQARAASSNNSVLKLTFNRETGVNHLALESNS